MNTEVHMEQLLTTLDVAKRINRSCDRVRGLEREGKISAQRTASGQRLFRFEDVERLANQLKDRR